MDDEPHLYLGLMSGTSVDGIDAVLLETEPRLRIVAATTIALPLELRDQVLRLAQPRAALPLNALGALDVALGEQFGLAALALLEQSGISVDQVRAIGSHGQTICHAPHGPHPFTLQVGDPTVIAEITGIVTVADFRRADVAAGGQGAPLLPAFHAAALADASKTRVVLNLGGIANLTILRPGAAVIGFDSGPANCLLDAWAQRHLGQARDDDGDWAASGRVDAQLLTRWLEDSYFRAAPPKSTGREYFNLDWAGLHVSTAQGAANAQASLLALTVGTISDALKRHAPDAAELLVCGGGIHNGALMDALGQAVAPLPLYSTARFDLDPDHVEAAGFAWLARQRLLGKPGNLPSVTGAQGPRQLGAIYPA